MTRPAQVKVFEGKGGWWARIDKPGYFMERGPYAFRWMALLAFPIQRWTWPKESKEQLGDGE